MRRACRGFTLLELMIVVALIGVLLGMVSFATGPNPARQARQQAEAIVRLIEQLRDRAVLDGQEFGLRLSREGYRALRLDAQGWRPLSVLEPWAEEVHPQLQLDGYPVQLGADQGPAQLLMLSSDEISAFNLTLASEERHWLSLGSDGLGEVRIDE